jgi:hypothetical protein
MSETTILVAESGVATIADAPGTAPNGPIAKPGGPLSYVHWGPVIAGAATASAVFFVLMGFAIALGLAVASPSPTWRDTSLGLTVLSAAWMVFVAIGSYALGGYIAGRVRSSWKASEDEIHFRDGVHGLLVWAIAVILGVALTWGTAAVIAAGAAVTGTPRTGAGSAAPTTESVMPFELDRLFRAERRAEPADAELRAEAARIIQTGLGRNPIAGEDRAHLVRIVAARTGLAPADAERRVTQVVSQARDAVAKARRSAIILGFTTAAALAAAAAAAWAAAGIGGRHRDQEIAPPLRWSWRTRPGF